MIVSVFLLHLAYFQDGCKAYPQLIAAKHDSTHQNAILNDSTPISNYEIGLQVVKILEASQQSIKNNGAEIFLENN